MDDDYAGPATLLVDGRELPVRVRLMAVTQPVDGRLHWHGRVAEDAALHELLDGASADVELVTGSGRAHGHLDEPDPWGRYRISGIGHPPFALSALPGDEP